MSQQKPAPSLVFDHALLKDFINGKLEPEVEKRVAAHLENRPDLLAKVAAVSGDDFTKRLRDTKQRSIAPQSHTEPTALAAGIAKSANNDVRPEASAHGSRKPAHVEPAVRVEPVAERQQTQLAGVPNQAATTNQPIEFPGYEIVKELGRGGMGVVYLAKNIEMDRLEVLKVLSERLLNHPGAEQRFKQEIRAVSKLNHSNIVTSYNFLRTPSQMAFAMEYVHGMDLHKFIYKQQILPVGLACSLARQIAAGLQHAHEKGLVHRDIKPSNAMLYKSDGQLLVKILDFGLAKATSEKTTSGLTQDGTMLGTPEYMAPEQMLNAAKADIRADIYSLGCTLYHMLAGNAPFGGTQGEIMMAHAQKDAVMVNLVRPHVPVELAAIIAKMMAKDPVKRFQTPSQASAALQRFLDHPEVTADLDDVSVRSAANTIQEPNIFEQDTSVEIAKPIPGVVPSIEPVSLPTQLEGLLLEPRNGFAANAKRRQLVKPKKKKTQWWKHIVANGLLLIGVGLWQLGMFPFVLKTPEGTIVIEQMPPGAEVIVDGKQVTVAWDRGEEQAIISVKPGTYNVEVIHQGIKVEGEVVSVSSAEKALLRVRREEKVGTSNPPPNAAILPASALELHTKQFKIQVAHADFHSIKISDKGFESISNIYGWPLFEINGITWRPEESKLLPAELFGKSEQLNYAAANVRLNSNSGWGGATWTFEDNAIVINFVDPPNGASDYSLTVDIPFLADVPLSITQDNLNWRQPWRVRCFGFDPNVDGLPPNVATVSLKQPLCEKTFDLLSWIWWQRNDAIPEFPDDFGVLLADREFDCPAGTYQLDVVSDDGIRVTIDGQDVLTNWNGHLPQNKSSRFDLREGVHQIHVEYFEHNGISELWVNLRRVQSVNSTKQMSATFDPKLHFYTVDEAPDVIRLVDLQPNKPPIVGWDMFRVGEPFQLPYARTMKACQHFLFAHAPSCVIFRISKGTTAFEAYAYNAVSRTTKFCVDISNQDAISSINDANSQWRRAFESPALGWGPVQVPLDGTAKFIKLTIDPLGDDSADHSYWLRPKFITATKELPLTEEMQVGNADAWQGCFCYGSPVGGDANAPWDVYDQELSAEYLYAHANSQVSYVVPPGYTRFTAAAGNGNLGTRDFEVVISADNQVKPVYYSVSPNWEQVDINIPAKTREITLSANVIKSNRNDNTVWAYPRFHKLARNSKSDIKFDETSNKKDVLKLMRTNACFSTSETLVELNSIGSRFANWRLLNGCPRADDIFRDRNDLYCLHPKSAEEPATIDFGAITSHNKGILKIFYRNLQDRDIHEPCHRFIVKRDGVQMIDQRVEKVFDWKTIEVPFDNDFISLEHWADGWNHEFGMYDFDFQFSAN